MESKSFFLLRGSISLVLWGYHFFSRRRPYSVVVLDEIEKAHAEAPRACGAVFFSRSFGSKKRGQTTLGYSEIYFCNKKSWESMWTNVWDTVCFSWLTGLPVKSKKHTTKTTRAVWVPKPKGYLTTMSWTCRSDSGARNDIIPFTQKQNSLKILEITG